MDNLETPLGRVTQSELMLWSKMANPETVDVDRLFGDSAKPDAQQDAQVGAAASHGDANPVVDEDSLRHGRYDGRGSYRSDTYRRGGSEMDRRGGSEMDRRGGSEMDRRGGSDAVERRGTAIGERRGTAMGERRGTAIGERRGTGVGERRGTAVGERRGTAVGERRGTAVGERRGTDGRSTARSVAPSGVRSGMRAREEGGAPSDRHHMDGGSWCREGDRDRGRDRDRDRDRARDRDGDRSTDSRRDNGHGGGGHDGPPSSVVKRPRSADMERDRDHERNRDKSESRSRAKRARQADGGEERQGRDEGGSVRGGRGSGARARPGDRDDASSQFSAKRRYVEEQKRDLLDQLDELRVMHGLGKVRDGRHREYGMGDDIRSIRFQVERLLRLKDQKENCDFMHDGIKLGCYAVETAVSKLGFNALDGWADTVDGQKKRLRPILAKLYHRWFKRGGFSNPYLELALALGGSAFICATGKNRHAAVAAAATAAAPAHPHRDANTADGREFSFEDFETPAAGPARPTTSYPPLAPGQGPGPGQGRQDDDDDDDDMPGPQDAGLGGGGPFAGLGGSSGIMGMVGSMMGMKS